MRQSLRTSLSYNHSIQQESPQVNRMQNLLAARRSKWPLAPLTRLSRACIMSPVNKVLAATGRQQRIGETNELLVWFVLFPIRCCLGLPPRCLVWFHIKEVVQQNLAKVPEPSQGWSEEVVLSQLCPSTSTNVAPAARASSVASPCTMSRSRSARAVAGTSGG